MVPAPRAPDCAGSVGRAGTNPEGRSISWFVPDGERDRATLNTWCGTVGPPVLMPEPGSQATEWGSGEAFSVVVWNVAVGGADLVAFLEHEMGVACDGDNPRVTPFAVLLQEVHRRSSTLPEAAPRSAIPFLIDADPRPGPDLDIVEVARQCGLSLVYVPSARNGDRVQNGVGEDKGNAILANVVLHDPLAVELPFEGGRKVAVGATVAGPVGPLRVVSVHLDVASTLLRTLLTGNGTRVRQPEGLANGLDLANPTIATVVGGDYNTWSETETALLRFRERYPESPPLDPHPTRGHFATDHIFFRTDPAGALALVPESYRRIGPRYYSDHNARVLEITEADAAVRR